MRLNRHVIGAVCLLFLWLNVTHTSAAEQTAVYFNAADVHWDQRCLLETLQGIVNREGPRLFLDSPAHDMPWDHQWVDIYSQRNGLAFRRNFRDVVSVVKHFRDEVNGMVVYDPKVDGSRYMAITMGAQENLLPVSPGLLDGYLGHVRGSWTGVDFGELDVYQLLSAWGAGVVQSSWETEATLLPGRGVACKAVLRANGKPHPQSTLEYGPLLLNLSRQPVIEVTTEGLADGAWQVQLVTEETTVTLEGGRAASGKWNLAERLGKTGTVRIKLLRLVLQGESASITWKSVRFRNRRGDLLAIEPPEPLSEQLKLEVKHDLRGKFEDSLAAYEWGLQHLIPRCNREFAHTIDGVVDGLMIGSGPWRSFDFVVMKKGFVFNLSFNDKPTSAFGYTYPGQPEQAKMYRKILSALRQPALVTGYGDCENDWFPLMSEYGHSYLVPQYCNTSFHAAVKPNKTELKQKKHYTEDTVEVDPEKYYVALISSDGDTLKGPISQHYQSWNQDPKRGSIPFTFAMPMCMGRYFPALLEYYYDTATENDYFTGCPVLQLNSSKEDAPRLYERFAEDMRLADYDTICNVSLTPVATEKYELFNDILDPLGIAQIVWWKSSEFGEMAMLDDGTPLVTNPEWFGYCKRATLEGRWEATPLDVAFKDKELWPQTVQKLVDYCELTASKHEPPFLILIFPSLHHHYTQYTICRDIAAALDHDKYKIVRFDEALAVMKKHYRDQQK